MVVSPVGVTTIEGTRIAVNQEHPGGKPPGCFFGFFPASGYFSIHSAFILTVCTSKEPV